LRSSTSATKFLHNLENIYDTLVSKSIIHAEIELRKYPEEHLIDQVSVLRLHIWEGRAVLLRGNPFKLKRAIHLPDLQSAARVCHAL
jgi:hypothetical protein